MMIDKIKTVILIGLLGIVQGCAQNKKEPTLPKEQTMIDVSEITADNFVNQIAIRVKQEVPAPFYYLRINQHNCIYEILVNDMPVYKHYTLSRLGSPVEINHLILQSGIQKVTYRLYPIGNLMQENYDIGSTITQLEALTDIEIRVIQIDHNSRKSFADEVPVLTHKSLTKQDGATFIGNGLPYYEYTFEFKATVPYSNKGWSEGQDLSKVDPKLLEAKVLEYYKMYREIYQKKDKDKLAQINFKYELRNSIAGYKNHERIRKLWQEYLEEINPNDKEFQPLENYKMVFYGDGRIVSLIQASLDETVRGFSALWFKYKNKDGYNAGYFPGIYLYIPKGKGIGALQMIK